MKFFVFVLVLVVVASVAESRKVRGKFQRQQEVPHTIYGPPPQTPPEMYGPPPQETTTVSEGTTTEVPTTTESESETVKPGNGTASGRLTKAGQRGVYYIYHPNGQLQKVVYSTKKGSKNSAYTAQLKYENVEPIQAPIFTYDPQTLVLTPLQN